MNLLSYKLEGIEDKRKCYPEGSVIIDIKDVPKELMKRYQIIDDFFLKPLKGYNYISQGKTGHKILACGHDECFEIYKIYTLDYYDFQFSYECLGSLSDRQYHRYLKNYRLLTAPYSLPYKDRTHKGESLALIIIRFLKQKLEALESVLK